MYVQVLHKRRVKHFTPPLHDIILYACMSLCMECVNHCLPHLQQKPLHSPSSCYMHACLYVRKCEITDVVQFSLVNVTATCTYVMLFCAAWANGEPLRILYPTDSMGRLCGSHSAVRWVALHLINGGKWMDGWLCMWSNWPERITCPKLALLVTGFIPLLHLETSLIFSSLTSPNVPRL